MTYNTVRTEIIQTDCSSVGLASSLRSGEFLLLHEHNVSQVIRSIGLEAFQTRMGKKLSGGNKRKLSLGIALIGNPTVLLLDEPSSAMDAASKPTMWKTLAQVQKGRSLVLTTHSMEEADVLASRVGILTEKMLAVGTNNDLQKR